MKNRIILLSLFMIGLFSAHAQTVITGTVKNKSGEPMFVTVTLQRPGQKTIVSFASTKNDGSYKMTYKGIGDSLVVTVRGLNIEKTMRRIANRSTTLDFRVQEKVNLLKEVKVSANPVRRKGDTLNYTVNLFKGQSDRTIEDVIKKLPGIDVSSSGAISYNGKEINKLYIENLDMLEGRYNLATRNIDAKDVASVQVYENHQPVKSETIFSDQAAINLKLKNKAKGIWSFNALAGAGYQPMLWNAELTGMHFAHNRQHISIYKGNNSGHTADEDLHQHYHAEILPDFGGMLSTTQPRMPNVDKKRYTKNRSHSVSVNQLVKIKKIEYTTNIYYYNEHLEKEGYALSTQYLPNDNAPLIVEETMSNSSKENNLDISLRLKKNEAKDYLHNNLNIKASWNKNYTDILTESNKSSENSPIHQQLDRPYFSIGNSLSMNKQLKNRLIRLNCDVNYSNRPHELRISPAHYFSGDSLQLLSQEVVQQNINGTLRTSYGFDIGDLSLNYTPRFDMKLRKLTSDLTSLDRDMNFIPAPDDRRNDLWYNTYQAGIDQIYSYNQVNRLKIRLFIPTYFLAIVNDDRLAKQSVSNKKWILNPSLYAEYNFTSSFKTSINGYYRKSYGNFDDSYKGYILQSYRNLLRNSSNELLEKNSSGGHLSFEYRDAIRMLFFNARASYRHSKKNLFYGYNYDGIIGVKTTLDRPTDSDSYHLYGNISKAFNFGRSKLDVFGGMNRTKSELLLQDEIQPYNTQSYSAGASINTTPFRFLNLEYHFSWMQSEQWANNAKKDMSVLRTHSHSGKIWFFPTKKLSVNLNVDYQYYNEAGNNNLVFADALVRYSLKQTVFELECNNLFNAKRYVSTTYSNLGTYINRYELRPLSFLFKIRFKI